MNKISKDIKDVLDIGSAHQVFVVFISTDIKDVLDIGSAYQVFVVLRSTYIKDVLDIGSACSSLKKKNLSLKKNQR